MILKKRNIGSHILISIIAGILFLALFSIKYESTAELGKQAFFTGKALGYTLLGEKRTFFPKVFLVTKDRVEGPLVLDAEHKQKIIWVVGNKIKIFKSEGKLATEYSLGAREKCVSICGADLSPDSSRELLLIVGNEGEQYGNALVVLKLTNNEIREYYRHPLPTFNPWKVQSADVDGDGREEIAIGVYKTAPFHPIMAKRPFLYNWNDQGGITPKWRGSRLARPFEDYLFADIDNDGLDEIISLEKLAEGQEVINTYKWKGFGFTGMGESSAFSDIAEIKIGKRAKDGASIRALVKEEGKEKWIELYYAQGRLFIKKED